MLKKSGFKSSDLKKKVHAAKVYEFLLKFIDFEQVAPKYDNARLPSESIVESGLGRDRIASSSSRTGSMMRASFMNQVRTLTGPDKVTAGNLNVSINQSGCSDMLKIPSRSTPGITG